MDVGTFELLNGIITYSDDVSSPPTQREAIWTGMSVRISPTPSLSAEVGVHATGGAGTTVMTADPDFPSLVAVIVAVPGATRRSGQRESPRARM